jgi:hypothetical protein
VPKVEQRRQRVPVQFAPSMGASRQLQEQRQALGRVVAWVAVQVRQRGQELAPKVAGLLVVAMLAVQVRQVRQALAGALQTVQVVHR